MRGVITTWKQDQGFGFIRPEGGGADVFVHIRDFGAISRQPVVGDVVTYWPMKADDGRLRAADAHIEGLRRMPTPRPVPRHAQKGALTDGLVFKALAMLVLLILIALAYTALESKPNSTGPLSLIDDSEPTKSFSCAGKQHCSEMESCEEAIFYQENCWGTKMDGDGDGVPCERQCGH